LQKIYLSFTQNNKTKTLHKRADYEIANVVR